jgi:hypothetical protein
MVQPYVDFTKLHELAKDRVNFLVRSKRNLNYRVLDSVNLDTDAGIISDQAISLSGYASSKR